MNPYIASRTDKRLMQASVHAAGLCRPIISRGARS